MPRPTDTEQAAKYERPDERLEWGACVDCGAPLWVLPRAEDSHCTPCHLKRMGFPPLPDPAA
jgi:hypothetical protein